MESEGWDIEVSATPATGDPATPAPVVEPLTDVTTADRQLRRTFKLDPSGFGQDGVLKLVFTALQNKEPVASLSADVSVTYVKP